MSDSNGNLRIIVLGKVARHNFRFTDTLTTLPQAGETFYLMGLLLGLVLWGFAMIWFIIAIIMIATSGPFPFNMGWWGFIFPVGESCKLTLQVATLIHSRHIHDPDNFDWRRFRIQVLQSSILCKRSEQTEFIPLCTDLSARS